MSLAAYLSKKYLTKQEPSKPSKPKEKVKKKKSKGKDKHHTKEIKGISIKVEDADEDDGIHRSTSIKSEPEYSDNEPESSVSKTSGGWRKVGDVAIKKEDDFPPPSIKQEYNEYSARMSSGARAGLQTAEQVQEDVDRRRAEEIAEMEALDSGHGEQETVYRDVTGRRIDIIKEQEELKRKEEEERLKQERFQRNVNKGNVQLRLSNEMADNIEAMKHQSMHQYADNEELNQLQKAEQRINDPAAMFSEKYSASKSSVKRSFAGLPCYDGAYEPNRFNIAPGYKWDGIDRSNGFESKWFERQNDLKAQKDLRYTLSMDL